MKKSWKIISDEIEHRVEARQSLFGFVKITIDGETFRLGHVGLFTRRSEPFRVGDSACMLIISRGGSISVSSNDCEIEEL